MSVAIACFGHAGPQAGGDPRVAELLQRTVAGQYQAKVAFDATLAAIKTQGRVPWDAPVSLLTLMNTQWRVLVQWEQATVYLDASVQGGSLSDEAYRQCDTLCDRATELSVKAVAMQTDVSQGKRPGNTQATQLPSLVGTATTIQGAWATLATVYDRVSADLYRVESMGVPPHLGRLHQQVRKAFESSAQTFRFLLTQWLASGSAENQVQLVRQALPLTQQFYLVGQQLWTPYLLGPVYIEALRSQSLFGSFNLGFDPWILTDPDQARARVTNAESCNQLIAFWQSLADPASAKALQDEINEAIRAGQLTVHPGKTFKIAPWHPHYAVKSPVTIALQDFAVGDLLALLPHGAAGGRVLEVRPTGHV